MKKGIITTALAMGAAAISFSMLVGCGSSRTNKMEELNIICLNRGYGRDWIDHLVTVWEEQNPGYTVHLDAVANADSLIQKHIYEGNDNIDDLYIGNVDDWKTYSSKGYLLELDDFLNETVNGMTIRDKVNDEYDKSIIYNGHTYRLPWTSGIPGIYYNAKMFKKNGWQVPTTFDDLKELCQTIVDNPIKVDPNKKPTEDNVVKPFVFTGEHTYYFDYAVFTWWGQLAGMDNVHEYLKYESPATFSTANPAFNKLGEALGLWEEIFGNQNNYVPKSNTFDHTLAQQKFYNGYAAMMINSDWLYNEVLSYTDDGKFRDGFELKVMNTPVARNAIDEHVSFIVGENQYFAIPKSTKKAALAKSFLKLMISDEGIETFAKKAHGTLAYKMSGDRRVEVDDAYTQSLLDYMDNADHRFTNWSDSQLFLKNVIDVWSENSFTPYGRLLGGEDTAASYMVKLSNNAKNYWNSWKEKAGI